MDRASHDRRLNHGRRVHTDDGLAVKQRIEVVLPICLVDGIRRPWVDLDTSQSGQIDVTPVPGVVRVRPDEHADPRERRKNPQRLDPSTHERDFGLRRRNGRRRSHEQDEGSCWIETHFAAERDPIGGLSFKPAIERLRSGDRDFLASGTVELDGFGEAAAGSTRKPGPAPLASNPLSSNDPSSQHRGRPEPRAPARSSPHRPEWTDP